MLAVIETRLILLFVAFLCLNSFLVAIAVSAEWRKTDRKAALLLSSSYGSFESKRASVKGVIGVMIKSGYSSCRRYSTDNFSLLLAFYVYGFHRNQQSGLWKTYLHTVPQFWEHLGAPVCYVAPIISSPTGVMFRGFQRQHWEAYYPPGSNSNLISFDWISIWYGLRHGVLVANLPLHIFERSNVLKKKSLP